MRSPVKINAGELIQDYCDSDKRLEGLYDLDYDDINYACIVGNLKAVKYMIEKRGIAASSNHLSTANRHGHGGICDYLEPHLLVNGVSRGEIRIAYL